MTVNRRNALGAMIGGAVAGPKFAKATLSDVGSALGDGVALNSISHEAAGKMVGYAPETLAMLRRVASGAFSAEDFDLFQAMFLSRYASVESTIEADPAFNVAVLKSVSRSAAHVIAHGHRVRAARAKAINMAVEQLLQIS